MRRKQSVEVSNVIMQIAKATEIDGYAEGVLEIYFPDDDEIEKWSDKEHDKWIKENNKRMKAICDFLNKNDL